MVYFGADLGGSVERIMLCQKCHKNLASVRYAEVVDGQVKDLNLCQECLAVQQETARTGFELSDPPPFVRKKNVSPWTDAAASTESCKSCGTDLQSIIKFGHVGCSDCYAAFPAQMESLLEGIHFALNHHGKVPNLDDARARVRSDLQSKRALLKTALTMENYEEAAALRDEIRSLETGLVAAESGTER